MKSKFTDTLSKTAVFNPQISQPELHWTMIEAPQCCESTDVFLHHSTHFSAGPLVLFSDFVTLCR